ncbi:Signal recognition particle subunit SRP72 [Coniosporium apollinis]|uniref:Signal recognition particle subunit SRP72 n=1 Tax=Coniosporium apollinis TaxID=61459 RepID=A0ABQ9NXA7_9PEZI|nr:Signal recognition particle subunit SRP72 [Coniosporium apollinis]
MATTLSSLLSRTHLTDHDEILSAANAVLKKSKGDPEAQHVKAVALLKLDRFDDALRVFEAGGDALKERARLEFAYALYKSGRPEEAAEVAGLDGAERGLRHLLAQATYRAEEFERAREVYGQLGGREAQTRGEENDVRINAGAVDAQLEWAGRGELVQKKKPAREDLEAFETAYNAACGCIARGELGQGEVLLRRARDLCNALEELTEEEKVAEIMPITVQLVYVLCRLGKMEEAERLSSTIHIPDIPDLSTRHIAQVNALCSSAEPTNPYLSQRLFSNTPKLPASDRLFTYQSSTLRQNAYAMDLLTLKTSGVAKSTSAFLSTQTDLPTSSSIATISVLNAAATANLQTGKAGIKAMLPLLEKRPNDVGLVLTIIQLYLKDNNHGTALTLLTTFFNRLEASGTPADLEIRYTPGLVGALVSLYSLQGRSATIRTELANASAYWQEHSQSGRPPSSLLRAAGSALLASQDPTDLRKAGEIFESLLETDPADRLATAGLIAAYATTAPEKITQAHLDALPPVARLTADTDAAALEAAGVARPPAALGPVSAKRAAPQKEKQNKAKKLRKSRIPKDFEEGKKVDPERWLPMRERSYYRPKGRKGRARAAGLTQGGVVAEEKAGSRSETPTPGSKIVGGGGGGQGAQKKKKKGKGGKW